MVIMIKPSLNLPSFFFLIKVTQLLYKVFYHHIIESKAYCVALVVFIGCYCSLVCSCFGVWQDLKLFAKNTPAPMASADTLTTPYI